MQGEKLQNRVTIQDIAREVDMSIATVSAVLGNKSHCYASEKTKTMIREKAREMLLLSYTSFIFLIVLLVESPGTN